jgi:hypothetical protein
MILIRFNDQDTERRGLGCLMASGLPGKTWRNGETAVPKAGLELLSKRGIAFEVIGEAGYERLTPIRDIAAETV